MRTSLGNAAFFSSCTGTVLMAAVATEGCRKVPELGGSENNALCSADVVDDDDMPRGRMEQGEKKKGSSSGLETGVVNSSTLIPLSRLMAHMVVVVHFAIYDIRCTIYEICNFGTAMREVR